MTLIFTFIQHRTHIQREGERAGKGAGERTRAREWGEQDIEMERENGEYAYKTLSTISSGYYFSREKST